MTVRPGDPKETFVLAHLWHEAWHDAHAAIVPEALTRARTLASFEQRLPAALSEMRVVGPTDAPLGFYMLKNDELYQLFVARHARGMGVASLLMADAEARLLRRNVEVGWLACAVGNERAARFYQKCGWQQIGTVMTRLDTIDGSFDLEVWRYEKRLLP